MNGMNDLYPPPGKPSEPPTWEDIERLSMHYPVVRHAVALVHRGDLTREQALILTVFALADSFQQLFRAEVERRQNEPPKPWRERAKEERADRWCNTDDALIWQAIHAHRGQTYEQCADDLAAALGDAPQPRDEKMDISVELHRILGAHGIASLSARDHLATLPGDLIRWAVRACEQSLCPHGGKKGACSWCDLRDDGGLPESHPPLGDTPQGGAQDDAIPPSPTATPPDSSTRPAP